MRNSSSLQPISRESIKHTHSLPRLKLLQSIFLDPKHFSSNSIKASSITKSFKQSFEATNNLVSRNICPQMYTEKLISSMNKIYSIKEELKSLKNHINAQSNFEEIFKDVHKSLFEQVQNLYYKERNMKIKLEIIRNFGSVPILERSLESFSQYMEDSTQRSLYNRVKALFENGNAKESEIPDFKLIIEHQNSPEKEKMSFRSDFQIITKRICNYKGEKRLIELRNLYKTNEENEIQIKKLSDIISSLNRTTKQFKNVITAANQEKSSLKNSISILDSEYLKQKTKRKLVENLLIDLSHKQEDLLAHNINLQNELDETKRNNIEHQKAFESQNIPSSSKFVELDRNIEDFSNETSALQSHLEESKKFKQMYFQKVEEISSLRKKYLIIKVELNNQRLITDSLIEKSTVERDRYERLIEEKDKCIEKLYPKIKLLPNEGARKVTAERDLEGLMEQVELYRINPILFTEEIRGLNEEFSLLMKKSSDEKQGLNNETLNFKVDVDTQGSSEYSKSNRNEIQCKLLENSIDRLCDEDKEITEHAKELENRLLRSQDEHKIKNTIDEIVIPRNRNFGRDYSLQKNMRKLIFS